MKTKLFLVNSVFIDIKLISNSKLYTLKENIRHKVPKKKYLLKELKFIADKLDLKNKATVIQ
tara:strand:+ start:206 stop:391 length:186 start_codon:yes stop_codon:yes gene_type:complete